ncbi:MAG TPA: hypothetical protein PK466_03135 [Thermotogota bacterium]|nr:hypothetical protein [Thermotogota bacterium]HPJ88918.1 hypothetical protein [Thermotogota bacterium]HPR95298.1 hypothetical protein [Thermotogota bacterium]
MSDITMSIGYMMVTRMDENKYLGGIMITDPYAIPVEFKYSEPIKPTGLQKILYGNSIEKYLMVDVIAKKLLQNIQEKPKYILLDDSRLLDLQGKAPTIYITNSSMGDEGASERVREELQKETLNTGYTIIFNGTLMSEDIKLLERISDEIDILEPFHRLKEALKYVCSEE